jgi:hypothetical protein
MFNCWMGGMWKVAAAWGGGAGTLLNDIAAIWVMMDCWLATSWLIALDISNGIVPPSQVLPSVLPMVIAAVYAIGAVFVATVPSVPLLVSNP